MKFSNAPIAEVVIGAQFKEPLLESSFIFDFFNGIKDKYPTIKEDSIIPSIIEKLNGKSIHRVLNTQISRKLFYNSGENKLIQMQPDKFWFNWRKKSDDDEYPHFKTVFKEFKSLFGLLLSNDYKFKFNQLEITYVDHILLNDFNISDYNPTNIINGLKYEMFNEITSFEQNITFPDKELNGNIHWQIRSANRNEDNKRIIRMETTCRGFPLDENISDWYENAHISLLDFFEKCTSNRAKNKWGIEK